MAQFRFQDLEIWKIAIELGDQLFDIADELARKHLYRFAEQVRAASMSMSNRLRLRFGQRIWPLFEHCKRLDF